MSDITKSERSESPLRAQHMVYNIRKRITAELMAYKRKLDEGAMPYEDIENSFKSWIGSNWKTMSMQQISNMSLLYYQLFERRPKWRKHSRLRWLMGQPWRTSSSTGTISSAAPS